MTPTGCADRLLTRLQELKNELAWLSRLNPSSLNPSALAVIIYDPGGFEDVVCTLQEVVDIPTAFVRWNCQKRELIGTGDPCSCLGRHRPRRGLDPGSVLF